MGIHLAKWKAIHACAVVLATFASAGCSGAIGDAPATGGEAPVGGATAPGPAAAGDDTPGPTPLRRLTRLEYRNTVRDLLGVEAPAARDLGTDEDATLSGFATGGPITIGADSRMLMETAEAIAGAAMARLPDLLPCNPVPATDPEASACARRFVARFGLRAFRRPLAAEEVDRLVGFYAAVRGPEIGFDFPQAIRALLAAILQSPRFLYRSERGPAAPIRDGALVRFDSYEMASRLSYTLWATMPDDRLFQLAATGELAMPRQIEAEARRMLKDPRARDGIQDFHLQWLGVQDLPLIPKDPRFSLYSPQMAEAMLAETRAFVADLFFGPGATARLDQLFTSTTAFVDEGLGRLYGAAAVSGGDVRPVTLDPVQRAGILTRPSFLATYATTGESHPVRRGAQLLRRVLCMEVEPPQNLDVGEVKPPEPGLTTRERYAMHDLNPCASCHRLMDPLGFAFEHYDAIGAYRETDQGKPVDASGTMALGSGELRWTNAVDLSGALARSPEVRDCMATQWLRYLLRRREVPGEATSLRVTRAAFAASSYDLRELLVSLTTTRAFTHRSLSEGEVMP